MRCQADRLLRLVEAGSTSAKARGGRLVLEMLGQHGSHEGVEDKVGATVYG